MTSTDIELSLISLFDWTRDWQSCGQGEGLRRVAWQRVEQLRRHYVSRLPLTDDVLCRAAGYWQHFSLLPDLTSPLTLIGPPGTAVERQKPQLKSFLDETPFESNRMDLLMDTSGDAIEQWVASPHRHFQLLCAWLTTRYILYHHVYSAFLPTCQALQANFKDFTPFSRRFDGAVCLPLELPYLYSISHSRYAGAVLRCVKASLTRPGAVLLAQCHCPSIRCTREERENTPRPKEGFVSGAGVDVTESIGWMQAEHESQFDEYLNLVSPDSATCQCQFDRLGDMFRSAFTTGEWDWLHQQPSSDAAGREERQRAQYRFWQRFLYLWSLKECAIKAICSAHVSEVDWELDMSDITLETASHERQTSLTRRRSTPVLLNDTLTEDTGQGDEGVLVLWCRSLEESKDEELQRQDIPDPLASLGRLSVPLQPLTVKIQPKDRDDYLSFEGKAASLWCIPASLCPSRRNGTKQAVEHLRWSCLSLEAQKAALLVSTLHLTVHPTTSGARRLTAESTTSSAQQHSSPLQEGAEEQRGLEVQNDEPKLVIQLLHPFGTAWK